MRTHGLRGCDQSKMLTAGCNARSCCCTLVLFVLGGSKTTGSHRGTRFSSKVLGSIHATRCRRATSGKRGMVSKGNTMHIRFIRRLLWALPLALVIVCLSAPASAAVGVVITVAPPPLPIYEQPICPGDGYLWTPGYWAWGDDFDDYYWVPGTWVLAPEVGFLWTPGWWGWGDGGFAFYDGYW